MDLDKNYKIKFGIIGTNFISDYMIEGGKLDERFEAYAVYSRSAERGEEFAKKHGIQKVYTSLDEMLADDKVDVVYIASPNYIHCKQTIKCIEAGRSVLCEKPMASNAKEACMMVEKAREKGVLLMEAMIPTISPAFDVALKNLHRVGLIRRYFASYCQYSSRYDNFKKGIIANAFKPELSNGAVMDIGVYCLYPMMMLFGLPRNLTASCTKLANGIDGQGTVVAEYEGFDAVAIYSKIADSTLCSEIQGEDGTLIFDRINDPKKVVFKSRDKSKPEEILYNKPDDNPYYHEIKHFIDLMDSGQTESQKNTLDNSINTLSVVDEIRRQCGLKFPSDVIL